jgi:hypothetical protein
VSYYTIGEVAERSGFSASALRYYEGIGLVEPTTRAALTIAWNVIEAVVAISAGIAVGSITLVGFGFDSTIEVDFVRHKQ